jgi:hypothetical protein
VLLPPSRTLEEGNRVNGPKGPAISKKRTSVAEVVTKSAHAALSITEMGTIFLSLFRRIHFEIERTIYPLNNTVFRNGFAPVIHSFPGGPRRTKTAAN